MMDLKIKLRFEIKHEPSVLGFTILCKVRYTRQ